MPYRLPPPPRPDQDGPAARQRDRVSTRSVRSNRNGTFVRSYTDEADVILVHCPATDRIYAVPVGESGVLEEASLRVTAPANGQSKGIRWAADHELPT